MQLLANINNLADAQAATAMGAAGVGLFRTEYLFLTHPDVPDEEEQLAAYREIIAAKPEPPRHDPHARPGRRQDDSLPGPRREANPFMGWRSIRLSFEHPEFFSHADSGDPAGGGQPGESSRVRLMFPMITTLEEMRRVRKMVRKAQRQLDAEGKAVRRRCRSA